MSEPGSRALPTGTVTFLFTDVEGSTTLARSLGDRWVEVVGEHDRRVRRAIEASGGVVVRTEGDAFFAAFASAPDAVRAAVEAQRSIEAHRWPDDAAISVRMGMHTGSGVVVGSDYVGFDVHRAARVGASGHGGQIIVSDTTRALVEEALPGDVRLRELGMYRLRDVGPQRLHQVVVDGLEAEFPPPRSLEPESNLPAPLSTFVGREREVSEAVRLLGSTRLLTITGPGGTGKTRLALEAARRTEDRFDAVWFVDLAPIRDPAAVLPAIAATLHAREDADRPPLEAVRDRLSDRDSLVLLDNFEQVVDAAEAVVDLLTASPRLVLLVTSRVPLLVGGEQQMPLDPLSLPEREPSLEEASRSDAVSLFAQRAAAVDPGFELTEKLAPVVADICSRLDGLPLAIELAASRLRVLTPRDILARLDRRLPTLTAGGRDLPERHRTLRSAIAWSEELLDDLARGLFARLSVLRGDWNLEAADAVGNGSGEVGETLDRLETLRDHALVRRGADGDGGPWFAMLETIREYGNERLAASGEEHEVRRRHARHFLAVAEAAETEITGPDAVAWRDRLAREYANLRAAIDWCVEIEDAEIGLRFVAALWRFWQVRATLREGLSATRAVLSIPGSEARTAVRARALLAAGGLAYWAGDRRLTRERYEEALSISRELGDDAGVAHGLYNLAFAHGVEGEFDIAWKLLVDAKERFERLDDRLMVAHANVGLAMASMREGDPEAGSSFALEALHVFEEREQLQWISLANGILAQSAFAQGDEARTIAFIQKTVEATELLADPLGTAVQLNVVAAVLARRGEYDRALRLSGAALRINEEAGGEAPRALIEAQDPAMLAADALSDEQIDALREEGKRIPLEDAIRLAREALEELAGT